MPLLAVLPTTAFPLRGVQVFTDFAFLLAGSLLVFLFTFFFEPAARMHACEIVHATGQKILVAASILLGLIEVLIVQPLVMKKAELPSNS